MCIRDRAISNLDDQERVKDYLTKTLASSNHLLSLINDVLDMSRIESGKLHLEEVEVNLSDVLHDLKTIVSGQIYAKQLELYMDAMDAVSYTHLDVYKRQLPFRKLFQCIVHPTLHIRCRK